MGTTPRRYRRRASRRCARPPAHDVPLEGRRSRLSRAADPDRRFLTDPRRPAQAPCVRRGALLQHQAQRGAAWGAVGRGRLGRRPRLGVQLSRRRHPRTALRAVGRRRRTVQAEARRRLGRRRARPAHPRLRARRPPCQPAASRVRPDRGVRSATGHADLLREAVDGLVGEDPPAGWRVRAIPD